MDLAAPLLGGWWTWKTGTVLAAVETGIHWARVEDHRDVRASECDVGTAVVALQLIATVGLARFQSFGTLACDILQTGIAHECFDVALLARLAVDQHDCLFAAVTVAAVEHLLRALVLTVALVQLGAAVLSILVHRAQTTGLARGGPGGQQDDHQ